MKNQKGEKDFDVIICGGGAAGLSAALWCDDLKLRALLLEKDAEAGGQLLWTHNRIENHLGARGAENGREMRDFFLEQVKGREFLLKYSSEISRVDVGRKTVTLADGENFTARFLIIATGVRRRILNVAGEEEFKGKGIVESGNLAQNSVAGKRAAIVGGGDAAFENALILAEWAARVFLIYRGETFRARAEFVEAVAANPKIEILTETVVRKIAGRERLEFLELENLRTSERFELQTDALLIRVGVEPNTEIFRGQLDLDGQGFIKINRNCETNIKDVFAVGDAANPLAPTVSAAVGMGATAVKIISEILKSEK